MAKTMIINSESLGSDNKKFANRLMGIFLRKLQVDKNKPDTIALYNSGVKLVSKGSTVLDAMNALSEGGVDIVACATCLNFFGLEDKVVVGRISNMQEIVSILMGSEKVITI